MAVEREKGSNPRPHMKKILFILTLILYASNVMLAEGTSDSPRPSNHSPHPNTATEHISFETTKAIGETITMRIENKAHFPCYFLCHKTKQNNPNQSLKELLFSRRLKEKASSMESMNSPHNKSSSRVISPFCIARETILPRLTSPTLRHYGVPNSMKTKLVKLMCQTTSN